MPRRYSNLIPLIGFILLVLLVSVTWENVSHQSNQNRLLQIMQRTQANIIDSAPFSSERRPAGQYYEDGEAWEYYKQAFMKFKQVADRNIEGKTLSYRIYQLTNPKDFDLHEATILVNGFQEPLELLKKAQKQHYFCYPANHKASLYMEEWDFYASERLKDILWIEALYAQKQNLLEKAIEADLMAIYFIEDTAWVSLNRENIYLKRVIDHLQNILPTAQLEAVALQSMIDNLTQQDRYASSLPLFLRRCRFKTIIPLIRPAIEGKYEDYIMWTHCWRRPTEWELKEEWLERYCYGYSHLSDIVKRAEEEEADLQQLEKLSESPTVIFLNKVSQLKQAQQDRESFIADILFVKLTAIARLRSLIITAALKEYKRTKGSFPTSLQELAPLLPDLALIDPFTGQIFHYQLSSSGKEVIFWSIGPDLKDDGGKALDKEFRLRKVEGDIVFHL